MPIRPPDQVITHRIEFGKRDREILEGAVAAYQFNKVSTPVVAGLSDVSFVITIGSLLTFFYPEIVLPKIGDNMDEVWDAITTGVKAGEERAKAEREAKGQATLDDSTGVRDFLGRLRFNLTNPNWGSGGPGVGDALEELFG